MMTSGYCITCQLIALLVALATVRADEPMDAVAILGKSRTFECGLPDANGIQWLDNVYNTEADAPALIFDSATGDAVNAQHIISDRLSVDDKHRLTITDLVMDDVGEYFCETVADNGDVMKKSYYLTLGGEPSCSGDTADHRQGDRVELSCEMTFSGSETPVLEWFADSEMIDSIDEYSIMLAKQSVQLEVVPAMDKVKYMCRATFGDMVEECGFDMEVKYEVQDVTILPEEEVHAGDDITCSASGNPAPVVTMMSPDGLVQSALNLVSFTTTDEHVGKTIEITCTANNKLDDTDFEVKGNRELLVIEAAQPSKGENENGEDEDDNKFIIIIAAVVAFAVIVVIIIIVVVCIKRRQAKKPKGSKPVPTREEDVRDDTRA